MSWILKLWIWQNLDSNTWSKRTESHGAELPTDSVAKSCREIETGQAQIIAGLQISCVATGFATTGATGLDILTLQVLQVLLLERSQRTSFHEKLHSHMSVCLLRHVTSSRDKAKSSRDKAKSSRDKNTIEIGSLCDSGHIDDDLATHGHNIKDAFTMATAMAPRRETRFPDHLGPRTIFLIELSIKMLLNCR